MKLKNYKVIIIGSKGFIGRGLVKYLSAREYSVYEADIVHEYGNPNYFRINPGSAQYDFNELFKSLKFDFCINCSGAALVSASFSNPLNDYQLNTATVYQVLNALRLYNSDCRLINMSSAAVYGNPKSLPVSEGQPLDPLSPYGFHKAQAEQICKYHNQQYGMNITVLRIFSAYGEGLKKQLFWDLYLKMKNNPEAIELFGTGEETRDFIYINDLCRLIEVCMADQTQGLQILNAANGREELIKEVVHIFASVNQYQGEIIFNKNSLPGYPDRWKADIERVVSLGYQRQTDMEQGLSNYLAWAKGLN